MKILVVEDSVDYINIYNTLISRMGHVPILAINGMNAIETIENSDDIKVVILDINLPDFDGIDLCKVIHKKKGANSPYIILVTGDNSTDVQREGLDSGADDFLSKPIDLGILESRIKVGLRTVLAQHQLFIEKKKAESLLLENKLFSQSFNQSQQPLLITDITGTITHINSAVIKAYGYSEEELIGSNVNMLSAGKEVYADYGFSKTNYIKHFANLWYSLKDIDKGYWDGYVYNKTKEGDIKEVHLRINSVYDSDSKLIGFSAILLDMTDILNKERAIRNSCYHTIVNLAELRDNETGEHLTRMSIYSSLLAEYLGLDKHFVHEIKEFAPFHDIGKVGIPDSILLAPRKLTKDEFEIIKTHPQVGYDILKNSATLKLAAEIAYTHHEKYNGKGYPRGLQGDEIPISGRIIALADVYDALRTKRPYKEPWTHSKVVELIKQERGEHFDPNVVDVFLDNNLVFNEISEKYNKQEDK